MDNDVFIVGKDIGEFKGPHAVTNRFPKQYGAECMIELGEASPS